MDGSMLPSNALAAGVDTPKSAAERSARRTAWWFMKRGHHSKLRYGTTTNRAGAAAQTIGRM